MLERRFIWLEIVVIVSEGILVGNNGLEVNESP